MTRMSLLLGPVVLAAVASALPYPYPMAYPLPLPDDAYAPPHAPIALPSYKDLPHEAHPVVHGGGYGHAPVGRVKIQVYRGPSKGKCDPYHGGYDCFAPWGYYNTQPADLKKKGYH